MKLYNIRIEDFFEDGKEKSRLICNVASNFSDETAVWFSVDKKYKEWLCADVYDAFLMAMLYPAMYHNEDIEIDGAISRKLFVNVNHYIQEAKHTFDNQLHVVSVTASQFHNASKNQDLHVGVGFGAGIDSFCSLNDHFFDPIDEENKVDTLCFFLVDNYGDPLDITSKVRAYNFYKNTKDVAAELNINACLVDGTSMFKFHPVPYSRISSESDARIYINGFWARIACALSLQKALKKFIISSSSSYRDSLYYHSKMYTEGVLWFSEWSESFTLPLVSPPGLDIISDGAQYPSKNEKIEKIIYLPIVRKYLRACTGGFEVSGKDCGYCKKCVRMMLILDILGLLKEWGDHFPIAQFKRHQLTYKCDVVRIAHRDDDLSAWSIIQLAQKYHYEMPSYFYSKCYFVAARIYSFLKLNKLKKILKYKNN